VQGLVNPGSSTQRRKIVDKLNSMKVPGDPYDCLREDSFTSNEQKGSLPVNADPDLIKQIS
jgi:hypothetical protein